MTDSYPDWDSFGPAPGTGTGPAAFCGDLSPASVLGAYRRGLIPFPAADEFSRHANEYRYEDQVAAGLIAIVGDPGTDPYRVAWWSPDPRLVLRPAEVHLGRNVRKRLRHGPPWTTTANQCFRRVAAECRSGREPRWLSDELLAALVELHAGGWAHSIEVWEGEELAGGAFGIGIGAVISGDSLFQRRQDAARVAVADMAVRLAEAGGELIDAQWDSPLLRSLGATPLPRATFLQLLATSSAPLALPSDPRPAARLLPQPAGGSSAWSFSSE